MTSNGNQSTHQMDGMGTVRTVADDHALKRHRYELARFAASTFAGAERS